MRDLPYSYAVPGNAVVPANGGREPSTAPRLESLRHRPRGFPAAAYDSGRTGTRLCLDLPAPLFSPVHLAPPSRGLARSAPVSRHVLSLQAVQSVLAPADHALSCALRGV